MRISRFIATTLLLAASALPLAAQAVPSFDPGGSVRSREDLERLLESYERALQSTAYSGSVKETIRADAQMIRDRLEYGDFRVGDRIVLSVQGEPELPDTLQVEPGPAVALPLFGEISLEGVLRSEISEHLTRELSRFIRDPVVRANGLMRLDIQGAVRQPGYYTMPAERLVSEALMVAGGPSSTAATDEMQITRGPRVLLEGEALQEVIRQGRTLDQLNLQAGDQIVVPERDTGGGWLAQVGVIAGIAGSLTGLIFIFAN